MICFQIMKKKPEHVAYHAHIAPHYLILYVGHLEYKGDCQLEYHQALGEIEDHDSEGILVQLISSPASK